MSSRAPGLEGLVLADTGKKTGGGMPYEIQWEPRGVVKKFSGHVTAGEIMECIRKVTSDPRFAVLEYEIDDYLEADARGALPGEMEDVVAVRAGSVKANPNIVAAYIASDARVLELLGQYRLDAAPHQVNIFSTIADARFWISRTPKRQTR